MPDSSVLHILTPHRIDTAEYLLHITVLPHVVLNSAKPCVCSKTETVGNNLSITRISHLFMHHFICKQRWVIAEDCTQVAPRCVRRDRMQKSMPHTCTSGLSFHQRAVSHTHPHWVPQLSFRFQVMLLPTLQNTSQAATLPTLRQEKVRTLSRYSAIFIYSLTN